jgi:hypothetical protein
MAVASGSNNSVQQILPEVFEPLCKCQSMLLKHIRLLWLH